MKQGTKKIAAIGFILAVILTVFNGTNITKADTIFFTGAGVTVLESLNEFEAKAIPSWSCELISKEDNEAVYAYASFTLYEDSYLRISKTQEVPKDYYAAPTVSVYSDIGLTSQVMKMGSYTGKAEAFLSKGTYYIKAEDSKLIGADHKVTINLTIGAVPEKNMLSVNTKISRNKNAATVSVKHGFGDNVKNIQYIKGRVSNANIDSKEYWMIELVPDYYSSGYKATVLNSGSTFTLTENGTYTIRIENNDGIAYSTAFSIKGVDKKAPSVTGVKNGRAYKNPVTIKFSDKGSGIKKATLNAKTIKSGKKVSKKGSYTLKVTDKAGNKTTIKFTIK